MRWCVCLVVSIFAISSSLADFPFKAISKLYDDCSKSEWQSCLKMKLITNVDKLRESREINLIDGLTLIADGSEDQTPAEPINEKTLEESLPRQMDARNLILDSLVADKLLNFASKYTLQWKLSNIREAISEGRGKKKYSHMMMMPMMMAATFIPIAIGALALLAGKALIVGKMALLLVSILGIRKLFANGAGDEDHQRAMKKISDYGMRLKSDMMAQQMAYRNQMTHTNNEM